jgi:hypothetical protein
MEGSVQMQYTEMLELKKVLESEMGRISWEELNFAIEQYARNNAMLKSSSKAMFKPEVLDELSTSIYFYRERVTVIV